MKSLSLIPVDSNSGVLLKKKEFALLGVSPFNSYFSLEKILELLDIIHYEFTNFTIFIPDKISRFTLEALGYEESRINYKIRKQDNYLKNKVTKALSIFKEKYNIDISNKVVTLSSLLENPVYINYYNITQELYNKDKVFKQGCLDTSEWVLTNHSKYSESTLNKISLEIAVQYFLKELPLFLWANKILGIENCCFVYPSIPLFLLRIYKEYYLNSINQGFLIIK
jgi:cyclo(L-tyrosyl-L-tyrosyl) synthase